MKLLIISSNCVKVNVGYREVQTRHLLSVGARHDKIYQPYASQYRRAACGVRYNTCLMWLPEFPTLYAMKISLAHNGKKIDEVSSYTAMRKISTARDANGIMRMQLNNKNYFQYGPLDQGWWPDGLYSREIGRASCRERV